MVSSLLVGGEGTWRMLPCGVTSIVVSFGVTTKKAEPPEKETLPKYQKTYVDGLLAAIRWEIF